MDQENPTNPDENLDDLDDGTVDGEIVPVEPVEDEPSEPQPDDNGSLARTNLPAGYSKRGLKKFIQKDDDENVASRDKEIRLMDHLVELRKRLLYCVVAFGISMAVTWSFGERISAWFAYPIRKALADHGIKDQLITISPSEGLLVYFQIVAVASILLAMPVILWQLWRFIEPALSRKERRFSMVLVPFSVVLFFAGCGLGYYVSPLFFNFFLAFQPPGSVANFSYGSSVALLAKMVLVFGVCFQVPVIVIFLHKIGLVSRNVLIEYWRYVVIGIFLVVAVLTPTWDPLTLFVCALPPCILYFMAIWMIKWL